MKAVLKNLFSTDVDLRNYYPEDEQNFGFWISISIGLEDEEAADTFQLLICTPSWITSEYIEEQAVWGRYMLIVFEYDLNVIKQKINKYIQENTGNTWLEIAEKLSKVTIWEFDGYQT